MIIHCEKCKKILGTIQESEEIKVVGEVTLNVMCNSCNELSKVVLYEYNQERIKGIR